MPKRTAAQIIRLKHLPKKAPDKYCNGRTPKTATGYCGNVAGFKTQHVGKGRCYLHGGASNGAPIKTGLYSKVLTHTVKEKLADIQSNPQFVRLWDELAVSKLLLGEVIGQLTNSLENKESGVFVTLNAAGSPIVSPKLTAFVTILQNAIKIQETILKLEQQEGKILTLADVQALIQQLSVIMSSRCGQCPIRAMVASDLVTKVKLSNQKKES